MSSPYPLTTARLVVRVMRSSDAGSFAAYRNDPEVARHQLWELPYTEADADWLSAQDDQDDLGTGWTQLAVDLDGVHIGDVCCHLDQTRSQAEVGFTLARAHWGRGYAAEAALALVTDLVDRVGVVRVYGELDPANVASQRVLEAVGLVHETDTTASFLWRGEWTDNMSYAATATQWRAWRARPTGPPTDVALVELGPDNAEAYGALETHWSQRRFVSPMPATYRDMLFPPLEHGVPLLPWARGVEVDGAPGAFCLVAMPTATVPHPYLWRLLVDRRQQGRGVGRRVLDLLTRRLRDQGHSWLYASWGDGPGGPEPFYRHYGFEVLGPRPDDVEIEGRLALR